jgi:hypothetical protein
MSAFDPSGHLARLGRRPVPSACTLCHTQQPSECATVKLILAWSFAGGVTRPIGAAFVACAAHAQQPATPRSKTIFITLSCVLGDGVAFRHEPFCEMAKAEIPNKLLRSYTGTRFVFSS